MNIAGFDIPLYSVLTVFLGFVIAMSFFGLGSSTASQAKLGKFSSKSSAKEVVDFYQNTSPLKDKVFVVTGGNSGIGKIFFFRRLVDIHSTYYIFNNLSLSLSLSLSCYFPLSPSFIFLPISRLHISLPPNPRS
jgi:hypothetical protein